MLGRPQEGWLTEGLRSAPERWNLIAQQTLMARARYIVDGRRRVSSDAWDGYPDARDRLLGAIADNQLRSSVVLSGDAHTAFVCDLKRTFDDDQAPVIAAEFCGTSIISRGRAQSATDAIVRENPHMLHGDSAHRGYWLLDVTAEQCTARLRLIDDPTDRQAGIVTAATFIVDGTSPIRRSLEYDPKLFEGIVTQDVAIGGCRKSLPNKCWRWSPACTGDQRQV